MRLLRYGIVSMEVFPYIWNLVHGFMLIAGLRLQPVECKANERNVITQRHEGTKELRDCGIKDRKKEFSRKEVQYYFAGSCHASGGSTFGTTSCGNRNV